MLAIDIATQIVLKNGTLNGGSVSLQSLYNNYALIESISLSGLLPVSFMLLTLHSVGIRSWYLLSLSSCTVALSAATLFTTGSFNPGPTDLTRFGNQSSGSFPACGLRDPSDHCLQTKVLTSLDIGRGSIGGPIVFFTLIILALIFSDYCGVQDTAIYERVIEWWLQRLKIVSEAVQYPRDPQVHPSFPLELHLHSAPIYTSHCLYFITWSCYFVFWIYYLQGLKVGASAGIVQTWSFGQIVAISVWAQPIFEYVKLLCRELPAFVCLG